MASAMAVCGDLYTYGFGDGGGGDLYTYGFGDGGGGDLYTYGFGDGGGGDLLVVSGWRWRLVDVSRVGGGRAICRRKEEGGGALSFHTPCKESLEQKQMAWPRAQPPTWSWT
ncbi:hypothetical protein M0R45_019889 [Rubus argutus]|uniref:Uncharacterized protein n=1 Tax=Rubus argutus TaxID=59490 RepID=A0AAW1X8P4_RUBAR